MELEPDPSRTLVASKGVHLRFVAMMPFLVGFKPPTPVSR
jgi:hypothetical protein